jgi:hypothetical protein
MPTERATRRVTESSNVQAAQSITPTEQCAFETVVTDEDDLMACRWDRNPAEANAGRGARS